MVRSDRSTTSTPFKAGQSTKPGMSPMFTRKNLLRAATLLVPVLISSATFAQTPAHFGFGTAVTPQDLAGYFSIPPDGRGLPAGSGTAAVGAKIFAESCAACHGDKLQG